MDDNQKLSVAVITANLGNFDKRIDPVPQSMPFDFYRFTDETYKPRASAMTPRLQSRLVMMFGWEMIEKAYDAYVWVDASCTLQNPDSVKWFVQQLEGVEIALFEHPNRKTVQEEADYIQHRLDIDCPYITPRYQNEDIWGQMKQVNPNDPLLIGTAFAYRNTYNVRLFMKEWWFHTSRYHMEAQMAQYHALKQSNASHRILRGSYFKHDYVAYVRK